MSRASATARRSSFFSPPAGVRSSTTRGNTSPTGTSSSTSTRASGRIPLCGSRAATRTRSSSRPATATTPCNNTSAAEAGKLYAQYREVWARHRNDPGRHNAHVRAPKLGKSQHVFVAGSDAEAQRAGGAAYKVWSDHLTHLTLKHGRPDLLNVNPASAA